MNAIRVFLYRVGGMPRRVKPVRSPEGAEELDILDISDVLDILDILDISTDPLGS